MTDQEDAANRPRYVTDESVFPPGVVEALRRACGGVRKVVTFRADAKKGPTTSEMGLPPALVMVCRRLLSEGGHLRTVHVRGTHNVGKPPNPHREHAETLVSLGFSAQAVADALGVHRVTVARWTKAGSRRIDVEQSPELYAEGLTILARNLRSAGKSIDDAETGQPEKIAALLKIDSESKLFRRSCVAAACFREFSALTGV